MRTAVTLVGGPGQVQLSGATGLGTGVPAPAPPGPPALVAPSRCLRSSRRRSQPPRLHPSGAAPSPRGSIPAQPRCRSWRQRGARCGPWRRRRQAALRRRRGPGAARAGSGARREAARDGQDERGPTGAWTRRECPGQRQGGRQEEGARGAPARGLGEGDRRGSGHRRARGLENSRSWKGCGGFGNRREGGRAGGTGGLRGAARAYGMQGLHDAGAKGTDWLEGPCPPWWRKKDPLPNPAWGWTEGTGVVQTWPHKPHSTEVQNIQ